MNAVFDTNIFIDYLNGFTEAADEFEQYDTKSISIITYMEVLAGASADDGEIVKSFLSNFEVLNLSQTIADKAIELRREHRRKLPDAIIYATAKIENLLPYTIAK